MFLQKSWLGLLLAGSVMALPSQVIFAKPAKKAAQPAVEKVAENNGGNLNPPEAPKQPEQKEWTRDELREKMGASSILCPYEYTVKAGDSLESLGRKIKVSPAYIADWNGVNGDVVPGQLLCLNAPQDWIPPEKRQIKVIDTRTDEIPIPKSTEEVEYILPKKEQK